MKPTGRPPSVTSWALEEAQTVALSAKQVSGDPARGVGAELLGGHLSKPDEAPQLSV